MKHFILAITLIVANNFLFAQTATLTGVITDMETEEPLISATIKAGEKGAITDIEGKYSIELSIGRQTLEFSYLGYGDITKTIQIFEGENVLDMALGEGTALLDIVTVTSGKFEKPLGEVTVSLEVVQPALLENTNTISVETALDKVPGVNIIDGQANIRGGSGYSYGAGSRVLLLIDDIPILQADAGFPNWADVPTENIAQIEVVKGAASALYGSSAMNGIINIRTAYAKSEPETKVSAFYTSFMQPKNKALAWWDNAPTQWGTSAVHRRKMGKVDLVFGGLYTNESGYVQTTDGSNYERYGRFNTNIRYRASDRLNFGFGANVNQGESQNYFFWNGIDELYVASAGTEAKGQRTRFNIDPFLNYYDKAGNRHRLLGRFHRIDNNLENDQSNESNLFYGEYQFQRKWANELVTTAGLVSTGFNSTAALYGDTTYTALNTAAYLQLDKKFFDRLNVSAGFRYERNELNNPSFFEGFSQRQIPEQKTVQAKPVFRLGLNYQAAEYTFLRASWGQGYRFPTIAEKFIQTTIAGGIDVVPNPELESETGWTTELAVKQGFRIGGFEGFLDASAFWSEYQNMMEFQIAFQPPFTVAFQANNVGDTQIRGLEFSLGGRGELFGLPTNVLAGYTYIDPKFKEFDLSGKELSINNLETATIGELNAYGSSADFNILKYRFQHSLKVDIESKIDKLSIGVAVIHNSNMDAIDNIIQVDERFVPGADTFREENKAFTVLNLRAAYQITPNIKFSALLKNALNEEYSVRAGVLEAPRNISGRVDFSF